MAVHGEAVLLQRVCHGSGCLAVFSCVHTAIVVIAIAASSAATKPGFVNGAALIAAINVAPRVDSIIATANKSTANANHKPA